jgi:hypothetical protein
MECSGEHPYTIKGEGGQTATTMEGTMTILMSGMEVRQSYSGKRMGNCATEGAKMVGGGLPASGGMQGLDRSGQMQQLDNPPPFARERTAPSAGDTPPTDVTPESKTEKAKKALKKLLPF